MTRTGTVVVRWALVAMLAGGASRAAAQNLPSLARPAAPADGWTTSCDDNPFRNSRATTEWQPTRAAQPATQPKPANSTTAVKQVAHTAAASKPAPTRWLQPTSQAKQPTNQANSAVRAPRPFTPPTDAEEIAVERKPQPRTVASKSAPVASAAKPQAVNVTASSNKVQDIYRGSAARASEPVASSQASHIHRHQPAHQQRPTVPAPKKSFDAEGWVRPLRQVAYQMSRGEEEMPMPSGQRSVISRGSNGTSGHNGNHTPESHYYEGDPGDFGPGNYGPAMPNGNWGDEGWIGPPGGDCCDDTCGPGGCCGPMCGDSVGGCSGCGHDLDNCECNIDLALGLHDPEACQEVRFRVPRVHTLMVNGGVHGFKGPLDRQRDSGNFGFQEGINLGFKMPLTRFGYQLGYQTTQSQLSGDGDTGITDAFSQHFFTVGAFRRERDGLQGGIAWDWLVDDRDTSLNFSQIRAEVGYVECGCHEFGLMGAVHLRDDRWLDEQQESLVTFQSVDQYMVYYRMHGARGGEGRVYAGLTDNADGLVGADFLLPLTDNWSLQPAFTYLIPKDDGSSVAAREEAWNIGINLVWHWKGQARSCHSSPYRPLFNVADNGSMIIDNRP
jgi:hypothetical protein